MTIRTAHMTNAARLDALYTLMAKVPRVSRYSKRRLVLHRHIGVVEEEMEYERDPKAQRPMPSNPFTALMDRLNQQR